MSTFTKSLSSHHYFDHNATTPVHSEVLESLPVWAAKWGNPSSIHWAGRGPKLILREVRSSLAQLLNVHSLEIVFTSGGSEANNLVLKGLADFVRYSTQVPESLKTRRQIIISEIEHPSVFKTADFLARQGFEVIKVPVSREGEFNWQVFNKHLSERTLLVSVMTANNETGVILPIAEIAKACKQVGALCHTDAVQAMGKMKLDLKELGVDYASFSAHKFYALKGAGFLYARKGAPLSSLIHGGAQERHRRAGTENTLSIAAMGHMSQHLFNLSENIGKLKNLRQRFEEQVLSLIPGVEITSKNALRIPNTSSLVIQDIDGETLLMSLDMKGFAVSTGAACSSGSPEPSPVLLAIGLSREEAQSSLRVSFGWQNTLEEVDLFIEVLKHTVERLRQLKHATENVSGDHV